MKGTDECVGPDRHDVPVPKFRSRCYGMPPLAHRSQHAVPRERTEAYDDAHVSEKCQLGHEKGETVVTLFRRRPIRWRCAAHARRDIAVGQRQTIVAMKRRRPIGETGPVKCGEEPVAGPVAGEDSARSIAAVRPGRKSADENARLWVPESGDRPPPVFVVSVGGTLLARDVFAPCHKAHTAPAMHDLFVQLFQARPHTSAAVRLRRSVEVDGHNLRMDVRGSNGPRATRDHAPVFRATNAT